MVSGWERELGDLMTAQPRLLTITTLKKDVLGRLGSEGNLLNLSAHMVKKAWADRQKNLDDGKVLHPVAGLSEEALGDLDEEEHRSSARQIVRPRHDRLVEVLCGPTPRPIRGLEDAAKGKASREKEEG